MVQRKGEKTGRGETQKDQRGARCIEKEEGIVEGVLHEVLEVDSRK